MVFFTVIKLVMFLFLFYLFYLGEQLFADACGWGTGH